MKSHSFFLATHYMLFHPKEDNFDDAIKWCLMTTERNNSAEAYEMLGVMYGAMGEYTRAKAYLLTAHILGDPDAFTALKELEENYS